MVVIDETGCDAVLLLSFGGPEGPDEVMPFLENVLRGRNVPRERMDEVAQHYHLFGGVSPINGQNRALLGALRAELDAHGIALPLFWGNRNWHPLLPDTLRAMAAQGVRRALAFATSAYGSYSGCRQYRDDIDAARATLGAAAPRIDKLRLFFNHPGFVEANAERLREALARLELARRPLAAVTFTAHSIPVAMAAASPYEAQVRETCALVASAVGIAKWRLVFQSRSGPPSQPWLEPDLGDHLRALAREGVRDVVLAPVGFICDHMEVIYDLDTQAQELARELGLVLVRAGTAGTHPAFVGMIRELVQERLDPAWPRRASGALGAPADECATGCCPAPAPPRRPTGVPGRPQRARDGAER